MISNQKNDNFNYISIIPSFYLYPRIFSQSNNNWFLLPDGLGLSNQLEYSYNVENKIEIFENWFTLDYNKNIFSAGLRFEVFQPNDPDPSISRGKVKYADIAYKYFTVDIGDVEEGLNINCRKLL